VRAARTVSGSQVLAPRGPRVRTSSRSTLSDRAPLRSRTPTLPSRSRPTTVPSRHRPPGRSRQRTRSPGVKPRAASSGRRGVATAPRVRRIDPGVVMPWRHHEPVGLSCGHRPWSTTARGGPTVRQHSARAPGLASRVLPLPESSMNSEPIGEALGGEVPGEPASACCAAAAAPAGWIRPPAPSRTLLGPCVDPSHPLARDDTPGAARRRYGSPSHRRYDKRAPSWRAVSVQRHRR
jgi:hypothetical protein